MTVRKLIANLGNGVQASRARGDDRGGGSTWQSLERGAGSVETDYLNGENTLLGRLHGLSTPVNDPVRRTTKQPARTGARPSTLDAADLLAELRAAF